MREKTARNTEMDIVKAIGILSIVAGHCCYTIKIPFFRVNLGEFLYSYHLMVFFFTAGFFFKKEYADQTETYIGKRLLKLGGMFVLYNTIFVLLHNILLKWNMIESTEYYGVRLMMEKIVKSLLMKNSEHLLGAFWFLPMFFIGTSLFAIAFSKAEHTKRPQIWHVCTAVAFALAALYANIREITWEYWIQTSLLTVPVLYIGYFMRQKWDVFEKKINGFITFASAMVILILLSKKIGVIELSINEIMHPLLFYPVTVLGIYFCIGTAKILHRNTYTRKIFTVIGKESFHIMALHFFAFKIVDKIYSILMGITEAERIAKFPHSDYGLHLTYVIAGVVLPLLFVKLARQGKTYLKEKVQKQ